MLRICIAAAAAALMIVLGAAAQTAAADTAGKPLQLLSVAKAPSKTAKKHHAERSARPVTHIATNKHSARHVRWAARHAHRSVETAAAATATATPPAPPTSNLPASAPAVDVPDAATVTTTAPIPLPAGGPDLAASAADGQTAQPAVADAGDPSGVAAATQTDPQGAAAASAPASSIAANDPAATQTAAVDDNDTPAARALVTTPAKDANQVGSAAWIAQVLAALGGAIAAGTVAWLLIGRSPQRTYG